MEMLNQGCFMCGCVLDGHYQVSCWAEVLLHCEIPLRSGFKQRFSKCLGKSIDRWTRIKTRLLLLFGKVNPKNDLLLVFS